MTNIRSFLILVGLILGYTTSSSAFFLNWGSPEPTPVKIQQPQAWPVTAYYQQRLMQPQYTANGEAAQQIPAIPIQVPLQAQLSPAGNIQNVQLVPCLCPVAQDLDYEKGPEAGSVFVTQIKPQQPH